jgi:hypothetical protein
VQVPSHSGPAGGKLQVIFEGESHSRSKGFIKRLCAYWLDFDLVRKALCTLVGAVTCVYWEARKWSHSRAPVCRQESVLKYGNVPYPQLPEAIRDVILYRKRSTFAGAVKLNLQF